MQAKHPLKTFTRPSPNMKISASLIVSALLLAFIAVAHADTLALRDGTVLQGKFVGGDATTVRFQTSYGLQIVPMAQVRSMSVLTTRS